jgi:hypothetical protein
MPIETPQTRVQEQQESKPPAQMPSVMEQTGLHKPTVRPAQMHHLTAYDSEFFIRKINDGEDVLVGEGFTQGRFWIRCDWKSFESDLAKVTPQRLDELFKETNGMQEQAPGQDDGTRVIMHACWRSTQKAQQILGAVGSENKRNDSFDSFSNNAKPKADCVKPLSKCKDEAVCSEYALLVHHILEKAGVPSSVVIGATLSDPKKELGDRHTFLVLDEGRLVYDPTYSASQAKCWPPKLFKAEAPLTTESLTDMSTSGDGAFGKKIKCTDLMTNEVRYYGSGAV